MVVQTPHATVGQNTPPDAPIRLDLRRRQIPQYLAVRRPRPAPLIRVPCIQRESKPFALLDNPGVPVTLPGAASRSCALLGVRVREQQMVRDILVSRRPLLRKVVRPSQKLQHRPDYLLLGDRLVRTVQTHQSAISLTDPVPERAKLPHRRHRLPPFGSRLYPIRQEILCKQSTGH